METPSTMIPLGTIAPDFNYLDTISRLFNLKLKLKSNVATVIMFISNHCPYVKHIRQELINIAKDYQSKKIIFIAIGSNDAERYPEDSQPE